MASKIYTKTGDKGKTSLIGGTKVSKADLRIEATGTVDELNSHIGLCKELLTDLDSVRTLHEVQDRLFTLGSALACDLEKDTKIAMPDITEEDCIFLEHEIDKMEDSLAPMKSFILPGGSISTAQLHVARCVCRRAERCCVRLSDETPIGEIFVKYLNRLSDYLFVLARFTGHLSGVPDQPWKPRVEK